MQHLRDVNTNHCIGVAERREGGREGVRERRGRERRGEGGGREKMEGGRGEGGERIGMRGGGGEGKVRGDGMRR